MLKSLSYIKQRLATIPADGLRYRFVSYYFENQVRHTKACTFYWVLMPSSVVLSILFGAITIVVVAVMIPWSILAWFLGFYPTFFANKGPDRMDHRSVYLSSSDSLYYAYGYLPWRGKFSWFKPYKVILPMLGIGYLAFELASGSAASTLKGFASGVYAARWGILIAAVVLAILYVIGQLVSRNMRKISRAWGRVCPDLMVVRASSSTQDQPTCQVA